MSRIPRAPPCEGERYKPGGGEGERRRGSPPLGPTLRRPREGAGAPSRESAETGTGGIASAVQPSSRSRPIGPVSVGPGSGKIGNVTSPSSAGTLCARR